MTDNPNTQTPEAMLNATLGDTPLTTLRVGLETLRGDGVLVQVHGEGLPVFTRRTYLAELGQTPEDVRTEYQTAGSTYTIPAEYKKRAHSLMNAARQNLDARAYDIQGFRPWRWLTVADFEKWHENHMRIVGRLEALKDDIIDNLDAHREKVARDLLAAGVASWRQLRSAPDTAVEAWGRVWDLTSDDQVDEYAIAYRDAGLRYVPDAEAIRARLRIWFEVSITQLESDALEEQNRTARLRAERAHMDRIVREQLIAQLQESPMIEPVTAVVTQLRERLAKDAEAVGKTIAARDYLPGPTVARLRTMIERINGLGYDDELNAIAARLGVALSASDATDKIASVETVIGDLAQMLGVTLEGKPAPAPAPEPTGAEDDDEPTGQIVDLFAEWS